MNNRAPRIGFTQTDPSVWTGFPIFHPVFSAGCVALCYYGFSEKSMLSNVELG